MLIQKYEKHRELQHETLEFDYVIAGGGLTGVCSAITAARAGIRVALVQDRPVLGGNASSEVRLWALGATSHMGNNNRWSREGGVIDELMVENTFRNKEGNPVLFDMVLVDKVLAEPNITLMLNTFVYGVNKDGDRRITSLEAFNPQNGTHYTLKGKLFADCTGDGIVGYLAGASFRMGAEEKEEFGEGFAPDKDKYGELLGHSILFYMKDAGKPVDFVAPDFALKDVEAQIPKLDNPGYFNTGHHGCKYWWLEYGGRLDTIKDTEQIKYKLWSVVYGVWNYIKNSGKFPEAKNLTLEWAGLFPGKRESRRFTGLYMINQKDVIEQRPHYDDVAFGGWSIDLHPADGVFAGGSGCNQWHSKGVFNIPYRCYVTPDLDNLFVGGRVISATHVANGSTRVMCTAAHGGQAFGMAAAICLDKKLSPALLAEETNIGMLQAALIKTGQFIPGLCLTDGHNLIEKALVKTSSELKLASLTASGEMFKLEYPAAQIIPVSGRVPKISLIVRAEKDTELEVQLRSSEKPENYTPDTTDARVVVPLKKGENKVEVDFDKAYPSPRYVFICFMTNPLVSLPFSSKLVSGLVSVFNYINPAVSNYGKQTPPEGIGVEAFEFWCPKRRPDGANFALGFSSALDCFGGENLGGCYYRPYLSANGWIPAPEDKSPEVTFSWDAPQTVSSLRLFFDTDFDHAMENVQMGHYDAAMPFCIKNYTVYGDKGEVLAEVKGNHQSMNFIKLSKPYTGKSIKVAIEPADPNVYGALMGVIAE